MAITCSLASFSRWGAQGRVGGTETSVQSWDELWHRWLVSAVRLPYPPLREGEAASSLVSSGSPLVVGLTH